HTSRPCGQFGTYPRIGRYLSHAGVVERFVSGNSDNYPEKRTKEDGDGDLMGVAGSVTLLQNVTLSSQPISSFDWSPDKQGLAVCTAFDQTVRVIIATKLSNNL
ncbi:unnamed protein product, partial [Timema podura]|nr:unnamed protein product [Timema podura]